MRILNWLLGRRPDPTAGWPDFRPPAPDFDWARRRFGPLRFGDEIAVARLLGRPDVFRWAEKDYGELLYARGGFELDFEGGRFVSLAFFIGPDKYLPRHPDLRFCVPRLLGWDAEDIRLSQGTDTAELERRLGPPTAVDADDEDETILSYVRAGMVLEFELNREGRLKRWNVFPVRPDDAEGIP
jgi:hypothetical protein